MKKKPQSPINEKSVLVHVTAWWRQTTSHYLFLFVPDVGYHMTSLDHIDIFRRISYRIWNCIGLVYSAPDSKVHGANMGPILDPQEPGGPHVGLMNFAVRGNISATLYTGVWVFRQHVGMWRLQLSRGQSWIFSQAKFQVKHCFIYILFIWSTTKELDNWAI